MDIAQIIADFGFSVVMVVGLGYFVFFVWTTITEKIDFLYLDSYDVDFLNPLPSAEHHLKEFNCVKHLLHKNSIVLIDDTPVSPEWLDNGKYSPIYDKLKLQFDKNMVGKGSLVCKELEKMGATKIMHQYQVLWLI